MTIEATDEVRGLIERYLESDLTDGLPVVPPTADSVRAMLDGTGLDPGTVLGTIPPSLREITAQDVAVNAVLAGCRCDYGPVVVAVVRAMIDERFDLYGIACSTKGSAPLIIINGPVRGQLGVNCRTNVFGAGTRANATIGRAVRLTILRNAGAVPDKLDRGTLGHPGRFSYCIGEDEEGSPWQPLHTERGVAAGRSAVTVFGGEALRQVNIHYDTSEAILHGLADTLACTGIYNEHNITGRSQHVIVLAKEHRDRLHADGWTKQAIKERVAELAVLTPDRLRPVGTSVAGPVRVVESPQDLIVVAAGGIAGRFAGVITGWSWQSRAVTVAVDG